MEIDGLLNKSVRFLDRSVLNAELPHGHLQFLKNPFPQRCIISRPVRERDRFLIVFPSGLITRVSGC